MRRAVIAACVLTATLAGVVPAGADPSPVYPRMYFEPVVTLKDTRGRITGYRLCAVGDASFLYVFGAWDFRMDGTRTSLSGAVGPAVSEHDSRSGDPRYDKCLTAYRLGYPTGHVHATFSYNGVGGDVPYTIEHTFTWCEGCPNPDLPLDLDDVQLDIDPV